MRFLALAALVLPFTAHSLLAAPSSPAAPKTIKIKEEIVGNCGNFPYAPTIMVDAKTATLDDMKRTRSAVDAYISEVSHYQKCLLKLGDKFGENLSAKDSEYIVKVFNRAQDERDVLAIDFNKLVDAYNAANGIKPKPEKSTSKTAKPAASTTAKPATSTTTTPATSTASKPPKTDN